MIRVESLVMEFNLNRGKVRSIKEIILEKKQDNIDRKTMFKALDDINFEIEKGEIFGIIGNNGAGKSTLLKLLAGIMKPTYGKVAVTGSIAPMIELGTGFDYELSALENIYLSGSILGYDKKNLVKKIPDIFDFSELWEFKDVPVKYFSSGMVARLAFSISTIVIPDVLIVDEILSVGDISFQKKSLNRMMELMNGGTTVVYVSHNINSLIEMCSRIMWLEKGKIVKIGSAKEVGNEYIKKMS